ncbi:uncharacterized protein G2W53_000772 [Senna tora]|uniref:Uncharacterized protein n=1 Tax=Senna tora TaxID=362788 RepID=A0A834XEZ2_9FABA|nr:uncharacterized protein G2W53_000772 [Senna tora]
MYQGRDSISEESLRSFVDGRSVIHLAEVTYESPVFHLEEEDFFAIAGSSRFLPLHYEEGVVVRDLSERVRVASSKVYSTSAMAAILPLFLENPFTFFYYFAVRTSYWPTPVIEQFDLSDLDRDIVARLIRRPRDLGSLNGKGFDKAYYFLRNVLMTFAHLFQRLGLMQRCLLSLRSLTTEVRVVESPPSGKGHVSSVVAAANNANDLAKGVPLSH